MRLSRTPALFLLLFFLASFPRVWAQPAPSASVEGAITDAQTGAPLADALVRLDGTDVPVDAQGRFISKAIPTGQHVLTISSPGHESVDRSLQLSTGTNRFPSFALASESVQVLEKYVATEKASGASAKFADKAGAETLTEVVSGAALRNPNSQSASDLLKDTSGVAVNKSADGTSKVSVRGLDQRLLRITVDGQRQGGTGNALDNIPPELVQSLEVTKSFTPDMEADAVGGVINVNTGGTILKTASVQGRHQLTYNSLEPRPGIRNSLTVGEPFSLFSTKPNASFLLTGSFDDQYRVRERISNLREWTPQISPGPTPFVNQSIPVLTLPLLESTLEHRQRTGIVLNADARFGDMTFFWRSNFNRDRAQRRREYNDTDPSTGKVNALTPTFGDFSGVAQSRRGQDQLSVRDAANFSFGGKTTLGSAEIDATFGYALTHEAEPHTAETVFLSDHLYRMTYDFHRDAFAPVYTATDESAPGDVASINDPAHYHFSYLTITKVDTKDEEGTAKFNLKINLGGADKSGNYLKFGGKAQQRHRVAGVDRQVFDPGSLSQNLNGLVSESMVTMDTFDYRFGPVPNATAVANLLNSTAAAFRPDVEQTLINSNSGDYTATETVWALYAMGKVKFARWTLLGGLRAEGTNESSKANQIDFAPNGTLRGFTRAYGKNDYVRALPGLHLRYDAENGLLYRASITRSLARPNYADLAPFRTLSFVDHRSRAGSPELKPYESTNVDLSADKYVEKAGLFSVSLFYKKIEHFIADEQNVVTIGDLGQFIEFKRTNGEAAYVAGIETNWQSPTWNLPANFARGSFAINYSWTHGQARYPTRPGENFPLPDQVNYQGSITAHLERGKFSVDAAARYKSKWWEDLVAPGFDNYLEGAWDAEISFAYKLGKNSRLTGGVTNLLNRPVHHYAGTLSRMNDAMFSGIDFTLGVQWKL